MRHANHPNYHYYHSKTSARAVCGSDLIIASLHADKAAGKIIKLGTNTKGM